MKISFTHPQVFPTLYEFLSSVEHKSSYFEVYGQPKRPNAPLTPIVWKKYYGSQWLPSTVWLPKYLLIFKISFVFRRQTFIQYMMTTFSFLG